MCSRYDGLVLAATGAALNGEHLTASVSPCGAGAGDGAGQAGRGAAQRSAGKDHHAVEWRWRIGGRALHRCPVYVSRTVVLSRIGRYHVVEGPDATDGAQVSRSAECN